MFPQKDFWLAVHELAEAYRDEGLTPDERTDNVLGQLKELPPITQRELRADLAQVALHVPDLYPLVARGTPVVIFGAPPWGASTVAGAPPGY